MGCNFCPFAAKAVSEHSVRYEVLASVELIDCLGKLIIEFDHLNTNVKTETSFIILPKGYEDFTDYLSLVDKAETLLAREGYEGEYQIASFHPNYCFEGALKDDPANYTNRSPYPMLQILREESITKALEHYSQPEKIPENNIDFARQKGTLFMQKLRNESFNI